MSDETTLLPCPFCGGEPTAIETHPGRGELYCGNCDVVMGGDNAMTPEGLTAAWNTRAELGSGTCSIKSSYLNDFTSNHECWYEFEMQCGYKFTWDEMEPPTYCPNCGRKVVSE